MKRKVQKLQSKKNSLSDSETSKFLSPVNKDKAGWKSERYRIILNCGYEEKEENYPPQLFFPKPMGKVVGFPKDLKLLGKCEVEIKKTFFLTIQY